MNSNEYIASGLLEAYVLGLASPEERKEVEKYASLYPEIKLELEDIEKAINMYTSEYSIKPPSYLKEKIFKRIINETITSSPTGIKSIHNTTHANKQNFSYWSIAASFLVLVSGGFAIHFGIRAGKLESSLSIMNKENSALSDSIKVISSGLAQLQSDAAILKDPMYKIVELKGLKAAPESKAMVCWCPADKKVYVEIDKLPAAPQGMQYQLWAIVDGKPVSEGMLTMGNGLHAMKDVDNAQAFAITLEKEGGNPTPKGEMYVMGTI